MHAEVPARARRRAVVSVDTASKTLTFKFESVLTSTFISGNAYYRIDPFLPFLPSCLRIVVIEPSNFIFHAWIGNSRSDKEEGFSSIVNRSKNRVGKEV